MMLHDASATWMPLGLQARLGVLQPDGQWSLSSCPVVYENNPSSWPDADAWFGFHQISTAEPLARFAVVGHLHLHLQAQILQLEGQCFGNGCDDMTASSGRQLFACDPSVVVPRYTCISSASLSQAACSQSMQALPSGPDPAPTPAASTVPAAQAQSAATAAAEPSAASIPAPEEPTPCSISSHPSDDPAGA